MRGQLDFILGAVTGTNNVNVLDDLGIPSTMVKIPKFKISDVISGGPSVTHPMFIIDGVEKDAIYIGKFESIVSNSRAYSLPGRVPYNKATFSQMIQYCRNKGEGWHSMTNAEYAGLSLWSRANNTLPRGNDYKGRSNRKTYERGKCLDFQTYDTNTEVSNADHYAGEQIRLDWTGDLQEIDLTGIGSFKLDSYVGGSADGTVLSGCASGVVTVPTGATKLTANIKRRRDKLHSVPVTSIPKGTSAYSTSMVNGATVIKRGAADYYAIFNGSDGTTNRLLYATSNDGINWGTPLKLFSTDILTSISPMVPSLLKDNNGTYRLWFTREGVLYYTESADNCANWKVPSLLKVNHPYATLLQVNVIQEDDNSFKLYFGGQDVSGIPSTITMATTTDGITIGTVSTMFTSGSPTEAFSIQAPVVYKENGVYYMIYRVNSDANTTFLSYRLSIDGIVWTGANNAGGNVLLRTGNIPNDIGGVFIRSMLKDGNKYSIYYNGVSMDGSTQLCQTTMNSLPDFFDNTYALDNGSNINLNNAYVNTGVSAHDTMGNVLLENGVYKMWGVMINGSLSPNGNGYYTSDDGINWVLKNRITLSNVAADAQAHTIGAVINDNGTYKMWYTETSGNQSNYNTLYSESADGITWSAGTIVINTSLITDVSNASIYWVSVIKCADGTYRALLDVNYSNNGYLRGIYYTDSLDGKVWTPAVGVLKLSTVTGLKCTGGYAAPQVIFANGKYRAVFIANNGLWYAVYAESTDMKTWTNFRIIESPNTSAYNTDGIWNPRFYYNGTKYIVKLITVGKITTSGSTYLNSVMESTDLINWTSPAVEKELVATNRSFFPNLTARNGYAVLTVLSTTKAKTFVAGEKLRFNCIGSAIKLNTNNATKIKIECFGASGADNATNGVSALGGAGGYSYGEFSTTKAIDLYLNIGGRGGINSDSPNVGYNGGGYIYSPNFTSAKFCGGGATDVRNVLNDLSRRLIVAGGGGTSDISQTTAVAGAAGGGWTGGSGVSNTAGCSTTGGTQTSHGTFDASTLTNYNCTDITPDQSYGSCLDFTNGTTVSPTGFAPGGGGFYGGGSSAGASGGGGSSYVSGNVNCTYLHPDSLTLANSGSSSGLNTQKDGYIVLTVLETTDTKRYNVGDKVRFNYTGAPQTFIQGNATQVQVECFGASGGYTDQESKGGYSTGILPLAKVDILSILVGGMGKAGTLGSYGLGGYNGGGNGGEPYSDEFFGGSGGGGATDVRSVLTDDIFSAESLAARLVVAGAGGGQSSISSPGDGGGWSGTGATALSADGSSLPGSQRIGSGLGQGGTGDDATVMNSGSTEGNGGGGGGYYGGTGGLKLNNGIDNDVSGAGGSSYVAGDTNCPTAHSNGVTLTSTSSTSAANTGDGYVIITITAVSTDRKYISGEKYTFNNINDVQSFSTKNAKRLRIECFGPEGGKGDDTCGDPGKGGYVSGDMIVNTAQTLQLNVGGKGGYNTGAINGYNGGGQATSNIDNKVSYGAGATDVRSIAGDLNSRIIVAGGGGSASKTINKGKWAPSQLSIDIGNPEKGYRVTGNRYSYIIKDGLIYKMWFSSYDGSTGNRIFYTTSTDGQHWLNPKMVMDHATSPNSYNIRDSSAPCVIKDGNTYKMWFTGYNGTNWRVLYSTSSDGITWSIPILSLDIGVNVAGYTSTCSEHPNVIKCADGTFKMWFQGKDSTNYRILYTTSPNGINWSAPVLVMNIGTNASGYNSVHSCDAYVILDGSIYRMWFSGYNGTNYRVLYSTSTDGITWTAPVLAVDKGTFGSYTVTGINAPVVILDNGVYKLWVAGMDASYNYRLFYSTSPDAVTWSSPVLSMDIGPVIGGYNKTDSADPCVILENGVYKMWYAGNDGTGAWRILYSTSVDFITWTYPIMVMDKGTHTSGYNSQYSNCPCVINDNGTYKMWFSGWDSTNNGRILYSTSPDGITWSAPVLVMDKGTNATGYNATTSTEPHVIKDGNTYKMWFDGVSSSNFGRILYSTSSDGVTWSVPVLSMNVAGTTYNSVSSFGPYVIKDSTTYKMWFAGADGTYNRIMYATSTDGITWTTPVLVLDKATLGTYNTTFNKKPSVLKDGSVYKMWFSGWNGTNYRILFATSPDGVAWTYGTGSLAIGIGSENNTWGTVTMQSPHIIKDGSVYKMWFMCNDGTSYRISYSTSADCITWTIPLATMNIGTNTSGLNSRHSGDPSVIKDGSVYKMWFMGFDGTNWRILYSTSSDGINWSAPVLVMGTGTNSLGYNSKFSQSPSVIKDGSVYKMWFAGADSSNIIRILYSTSSDGINWSAPVLVMDNGTNPSGYNSNSTVNPYVLKDGSVYKMWFSGADINTTYRLLYSTSLDGITWAPPVLSMNVKENVYTPSQIAGCSILKDVNIYKLCFAAQDINNNMRILTTTMPVDQNVIPVDGYDGGDFNSSELNDAGVAWDSVQLAIDIGGTSYNTITNTAPTIVKDGIVYKMWFTGGDASYGRILYTSSTDLVNWSNPIMVMDKGTMSNGYNSASTVVRTVIKDGSLYKLWGSIGDGTNIRIMYSTSLDGITWATPIMVMDKGTNADGYNSVYSAAPMVIKDGTTYKMWFNGNGSGNTIRVLYSTSTDGVNWSTPILSVGPGNNDNNIGVYNSTNSEGAMVIKEGSIYKMWFDGNQALTKILYATSLDGIHWSTPTLSLDIGGTSYNTQRNINQYVIKDGDIYRMWFAGYDGTNWRILYTTSKAYNTQTIGTTLPFTDPETKNYGTGTKVAQKGIGAVFQALGEQYDTFLSNYSNMYAPGAGGWFGGLTYNGPGQGGNSYIAGNPNCPTKHPDGILMFNTVCKPGVNSGDGKIIITILETDDDFKYQVGDKIWFKYTGAPEAFNTRNATSLKMELWGAGLGNGRGGYTYGDYNITKYKITTLNVVVGMKGGTPNYGTPGIGGYNGGGNGGIGFNSTYLSGTGGGGATDVRTSGNTTIMDSDALLSRIIVAAGGGGYNIFNDGGSGGGWTGTIGGSISGGNGSGGTPGSQTTGNAMGQGGVGDSATTTAGYAAEGNGGGGGGYYGGTGGKKLTTGINSNASGGGGSSYAAGNSNCPSAQSDGILLTNTGTIAGDNTIGNRNGVAIFTILSTDDTVYDVDNSLIYTGTGRNTWAHNGQNTGIFDLVGNLHTLCTGLRINGTTKEPQIIINNNAAKPNIDFTDESNWVALGYDGSAVSKGFGSKYTNAIAGSVSFLYSAMTLDSYSYIHKALGLIPAETGYDYETAMIAFQNLNNTALMNACYRGGGVGDISTVNSMFSALFKAIGNEDIDSNRGFRVCYYEP